MERRNTIQKKLVIDAVIRLANHPTAEEVYDEVILNYPTVSKATVYRNLASLSKDGRLRHIHMPDGADRFDHTLTPHFHISCRSCGKFRDVNFPRNEQLDVQVEAITAFHNVAHDVVFSGECEDCVNNLSQTNIN